ncbi:hypothetical protein OH733_24030 [Streptomyces griseus]|uniref:hypothetical protein n=2 Tax=Streptomyces griseus TaxID=1911 RepID=UPI00386E7B16|nr:hypothetical protein OH733_24030 [Streptomyces griseus]
MGSTSFEGMSHKQMIAWLDQANSAAVQGVADRLSSAAKEISKIGEELKIRPQIVKWKGEGADSFRTWSADLANATLRLGEFSKDASNRLGETATAIAQAKAAIPRPTGDPEASLKAAESARNDPDSAGLIKKLNGEREAAAAEMRKLSQTYSHSVAQLDNLKRPTFPPPPQVIAPDAGAIERGGSSGHISGGVQTGGVAAGAAPGVVGSASTPEGGDRTTVGASAPPLTHVSVSSPAVEAVQRPVDMEIDSVGTLPPAPSNPVVGPAVTPGLSKPDGILTTPAVLPPVVAGGPTLQPPTNTGGRTTGVTRPPMALGTGPLAPPARDSGITGGRSVAQTPGRPVGGLPRGTVIGGEGTHSGRGMMGHGTGAGAGGAVGGSRSGIVGGRQLAREAGGIVGGRPPQPPGGATGRPFTPGGTGLVRGAGSGDGSRGGVGQMGRGTTPQRAGDPRRDQSERPDYLVEDEETWQQGSRRVVPPVVD